MEPHRWTAFRVVHGPVEIDGELFRAVEADDNRRGKLKVNEQWSEGTWSLYTHGPGRRDILNAPPMSSEILEQAGVDPEPFPPGYDPLAKRIK